jgi:hypothetical protein
MNVERINELKRFVEEFNSQIDEAYKRYESVTINNLII